MEVRDREQDGRHTPCIELLWNGKPMTRGTAYEFAHAWWHILGISGNPHFEKKLPLAKAAFPGNFWDKEYWSDKMMFGGKVYTRKTDETGVRRHKMDWGDNLFTTRPDLSRRIMSTLEPGTFVHGHFTPSNEAYASGIFKKIGKHKPKWRGEPNFLHFVLGMILLTYGFLCFVIGTVVFEDGLWLGIGAMGFHLALEDYVMEGTEECGRMFRFMVANVTLSYVFLNLLKTIRNINI